jgi:DNA repair exonuclease SbcCD nuclease subunit
LPAKPGKSLRLLHTADVHLETDTFGLGKKGDNLRDQARHAFAGVVELANRREVDLILIVGDLFDSNRVSEEGLAFGLKTISRARMPVVMIPGNHDPHDERSVYAGLGPGVIPENLHLILDPDGRTLDFPELAVRIWGRALVEHSPEYRPLAGLPRPEPCKWNIAMAHGLFVDGDATERSSPITRAEIEQSGYDYLALGHVHIFIDVSQGSTRAIYCGTPAPLYAGDDAGWVAIVDCVPGEPVAVERVMVR